MGWLSRRISKEQELEEEMQAHLAIEMKQQVEAGQTPEEARRAALRQFGHLGLVMEVTRGMWKHAWLDSLGRDVKYGLRTMRKTPGFTSIAVLTLALGIGAITAMFSVVNGILLRPLSYPESNRIAVLWRLAPVSAAFGGEVYPWGKLDFHMFLEQTRTFEALGAFEAGTFNMTGSGEPVFLEGMRASAGFFPALGVSPALGRFYSATEDQRGHERVAVLSNSLWRERFGADPSVLGRAIQLNGLSYTVIGVMPPGFSFPHAEEMPADLEFPREAQLWVPAAIGPNERGPNELAVIGRLRASVTMEQAQAELDVFGQNLARLDPRWQGWTRSRAIPLEAQIVGDSRRPLLLLLGAVGVVLLIACSNVAGLVLTRSLARRPEFRLRAALGAGHARLIIQLLVESLLLALAGGTLGIVAGAGAIQFVKRFGPASLPRFEEVSLDLPVFTFCFGVTLITGLLCGLVPALGAARENLTDSLRSGPRVAGRRLSPLLRNGLLISQIALALVLVIAAGLLTRTFFGLISSDRGFKAERVLTFEISLPALKYPDSKSMANLYTRVLSALRGVPGVESAGMAHAVPMGGSPDSTVIRVPDQIPKPGEHPYANYMFASPGYFATVRTPLLRGRDFLDTDTLDAMHVTIVNRAMADALWPGQNAVGKQVGVATTKIPVRTVVGVVANVKQNSLREEVPPEMYVPYSQNEIKVWPPMDTMQVAVRAVADPGQLTASIRAAIRSVDANLPLAKVATLTALVDHSLVESRFAMLLLAAFGTLALVLASIGMYGVVSRTVTQRTQEIGIRVALGADRANIFAMILAEGARLAGSGIAIGLIAAWAVARSMSSFLYGVRPLDPLTFGFVSLLLAIVALLACYVPAGRAMCVDPVVALRHE